MQPPSNIIYISASNNGTNPRIYAIDKQGNLWYQAGAMEQNYIQLKGNFSQISYDAGPPFDPTMTPAKDLEQTKLQTRQLVANNQLIATNQLPAITLTLDPGNGQQKLVLRGTYSIDSPSNSGSVSSVSNNVTTNLASR